jgi:hypothetical protein
LADLAGVDLAFVGETFLVADRVGAREVDAAFFLAAVAAVRCDGAAGFFFFVGAPIFIPGMPDTVVSCPACCGCWARPGALAMSETTTSANARRQAWGDDNENIADPKFEYGALPDAAGVWELARGVPTLTRT